MFFNKSLKNVQANFGWNILNVLMSLSLVAAQNQTPANSTQSDLQPASNDSQSDDGTVAALKSLVVASCIVLYIVAATYICKRKMEDQQDTRLPPAPGVLPEQQVPIDNIDTHIGIPYDIPYPPIQTIALTVPDLPKSEFNSERVSSIDKKTNNKLTSNLPTEIKNKSPNNINLSVLNQPKEKNLNKNEEDLEPSSMVRKYSI